ncbi:MAG: hypothetical protein ACRBCS_04070 [Cellvibrionaceae bacterium]
MAVVLFKYWISKLCLNFTVVWLLLTTYQIIRFGTTDADYKYAVLWGAITAVFAASIATVSSYRIRRKEMFNDAEKKDGN